MTMRLRFMSLSITCLLLGACSGQQQSGEAAALSPASPVQTPALAGLPALDALAPLARAGSISNVQVVEGDSPLLTGGTTTEEPSSALAISSQANELSYAIYGFNLPDSTQEIQLISGLFLELGTPGTHYLAIANYESGRWEAIAIEALQDGPQTISDSASRVPQTYRSPTGNCYVAVLAFAGQSLTLDSISLISDMPLLPPAQVATNGLLAQETFAGHIEINWAPAVGAEGYKLYARYVDDGPEAAFNEIAVIPGGETDSFQHSAESTPEFVPAHGEQIEYKLKSYADGEDSLLFSEAAIGLRSIPPPLTVSVVDQAHNNSVYVEWSSVEDATGYLLYVDDALEPALSGAATYAWVIVSDFDYHNFHVSSVTAEGEGQNRTTSSTPGSCIEWSSQSPMLESYSGVRLFSLAVVDGKPAIAFNDVVSDGIYYARSSVSEPGGTSDWVVTMVDLSAESNRLDLQECSGLPWIVYDTPGGDGDWNLRVAYADSPAPEANGDWDSFPIAQLGFEAEENVQLAEVNGLLHFIDQDWITVDEDQETQTFIYSAADAMPSIAGDWSREAITEDPLRASTFDIAEIAGGLAVAYRRGEIYYAWTDSAQPAPADWTTSSLPLPQEPSAITIAELLATPDDKPSIMLTYRGDGEILSAVRLFHSALTVPLAEDDWEEGSSGIQLAAVNGLDFCYFLGRAHHAVIYNQNFFDAGAALDAPPLNDPLRWSNYNLENLETDTMGSIKMLLYDGRPLVVNRRNIAGGSYLDYRRVLPKT